MSLHTILGAGGMIANELVPILLANKENIRIVARHPKQQMGLDAVAADLENYEQTLFAIKGSSIVYLLVGLEYDSKIWAEKWPLIMTNTINACKATGAKLIFFDNVYMYGKVEGYMTEETPFRPCSKKGMIRAAIAKQLLQEMANGSIQALIARSADFYGTKSIRTSFANTMVFSNLSKGKTAQWLVNAKTPHAFTYVPDAAKALYLLANDATAYGQTWHLPTQSNPLTGEAFVAIAAQAMHQKIKVTVLSKFMVRLAGLFVKPIKESYEMMYQNDAPYLFDSSKFEQHFGIKPTSYEAGIVATAKHYL
jgi:nucleoside-diphosphate-sugar epimerase